MFVIPEKSFDRLYNGGEAIFSGVRRTRGKVVVRHADEGKRQQRSELAKCCIHAAGKLGYVISPSNRTAIDMKSMRVPEHLEDQR